VTEYKRNGDDLLNRYITYQDVGLDYYYNGGLYAWGRNADGQLGLGDTTNRSSPVQVGSLTDWKTVVGGFDHTLVLKTDGTIWVWGRNTEGQLGLGDTTNRSSPVQVGTDTNWKVVTSTGGRSSLAIQTI
jgi:alpha-tubulin suppressor-like RCC1 family protein